ncbi:Retrovirus-related Pol polyprotein from transposon 17.6 [Stylophora pistillata]|uniref:Retrovirus-related Pol polyprotein from transposon 17.6 n=1 Tax=Stylophora pistillata TaxID=50429 RepID=A0A2B4RH76_STYPI|nr:Retrovirus-related Pol polyprotein from transposon 17.6 [Stylophora pistillata]
MPSDADAALSPVRNIGKVQKFTVGTDFEAYTEQLELFFVANGVSDAKQKKGVLLTNLPIETYQLAKDLMAPTLSGEDSLTYNAIVERLCEQWKPQKSALVARYEFDNHARNAGETVSQYVAVLKHLALPVRLACDASPTGIGAVLSHVMSDGSERPVAFASRSLTKTERRYAQIDKEALSIVWGVRRFHVYLYDRRFTLITDHKPLTAIFQPEKGVPAMNAARLQRYALFLSGFDYKIECKSTTEHCNADGLSRLPLQQKELENIVQGIRQVQWHPSYNFSTVPSGDEWSSGKGSANLQASFAFHVSKLKANEGEVGEVSHSLQEHSTLHHRDYRGDVKWRSGRTVNKTGPLMYEVHVAPGMISRRHIDQLKPTAVEHTIKGSDAYCSVEVSRPEVTSAPPTPIPSSAPYPEVGKVLEFSVADQPEMGPVPVPAVPNPPDAIPMVQKRWRPQGTRRAPKRLDL